jgi:CcmD family protein
VSFVVAAYAALWVGLFAYLVSLGRRLRALSEEARALSEDSAEPRDAAAPAGRP